MPSMNERPQTQVHHVPRRAVVIAHQVEGHGDVGVAVIQTQIVLQQNRMCSYYYLNDDVQIHKY